jgi:hypothetical protein
VFYVLKPLVPGSSVERETVLFIGTRFSNLDTEC